MAHWKHGLRKVSERIVVLLVSCAVSALGEPQHYVETSDFSGTEASPSALSPALGVGVNRVTGSVSEGGLFPDIDYFSVQIAPETAIVSMSLAVSNYVSGVPTTLDLVGPGSSGQIPVLGNTTNTEMSVFTLGSPDRVVVRVPDPLFVPAPSFDYVFYIEVISTKPPGPTLRIEQNGNLSWNAESGTVYQVQWADTPATNGWNNQGAAVMALTDSVTVTNDISTVGHRFYRLIAQGN